jgi:RNA polymerase sigma factor (sigma-70 family)
MSTAVALRTAHQRRLSEQALRILKDEKLAAMVAGGNDDAFAVLYRRHHQAVYGYCVSVLRQEADARDALQSSMLAALSSLRANPISGPFKPWLFRIAHNESISIIRNRSREAPAEAQSQTAVADDGGSREQLRSLLSDLAALPDRQRGAIVMRELSGLSYAEIAAALGTSEAGGKQLVYQARQALQELRDGHEMNCQLVRQRISAQDRRLLRGRKVRSHLRGCQTCRDFDLATRRRRTAFAALIPPLSPLVAAAVLQGVLREGGTGGGVGGAGGAVGATGLVSGGAPLAPVAVKLAAAALLAGAAGVGAYEAGNAILGDPAASEATTRAAHDGSARQDGRRDAREHSEGRARGAAGHGKDRGVGGDPTDTDHAKASGAAGGAATAASPGGETASSGPSGASDVLAAEDSGGSGSSGGDGTGGSPSTPSTSGSADPKPPASGGGSSAPPGGGGGSSEPPAPPSGGGGSGVPPEPPAEPPTGVAPGTPPGHGGLPPGQGGAPPGQVAGDIPPGQLGNPGGGHH